jgi:hypothetical protein
MPYGSVAFGHAIHVKSSGRWNSTLGTGWEVKGVGHA